MKQDMNHTFGKALRAVFVAGMMSLTGSHALAQVTVNGNVYGGGNAADVGADATVNISAGTMVNVYGGGKGQNTTVVGDVTVNIGKFTKTTDSGTQTVTGEATITGSVYGGSALGTVNAAVTKDDGVITGRTASDDKSTSVNIFRSTIDGSVYGGGEGDDENDIEAQVCKEVIVTVGTAAEGDAPKIKGSVYGGCNANGVLWEKSEVNVVRGTIGSTDTDNNLVDGAGNVHGGGFGQKTLVKGNVEVNIGATDGAATPTYSGDAYILGDVYGGSAKGNVNAERVTDNSTNPATTTLQYKVNTVTNVNLYGGTVNGDVYGGGLGDNTSGSEIAANVYGPVTVGIYGGTARNVFGCNNHYGSPQDNVIVNIAGGTVNNNVFGGGQEADALRQITVNVTGGTVTNDVYGGGALADTNTANWDATNSKFLFFEVTGLTVTSPVTGYYTKTGDDYTLITASDAKAEDGKTYYSHYTTTVNLTGGTIGNAYGGALGSTEKAANVWGDVYLTVDGTAFTISNDSYTEGTGDNVTTVQVPKSGRVFGCNNINGTPKREVTVHVKQTVPSGGGDHTLGAYEIAAVYGGGNLAPYEPKKAETESTVDGDDFSSDDTKASTNVIIDGCGDTSIGTVYGGGNAASTPSTKVTVNGAYEIGELFGGGNGKDKIKNGDEWKDNPGAHVGFKAYTTESEKDGKKYGSGQARVNIYGGKIHAVYGGSNTLGNVRRVAVAMLDEVVSTCPIAVDEAYGGGKSADMDGKAILNLGCIPGLKNVYGGARAATVNNNVVLNITNGTYENVFGGNNESGNINGSITVNVEETGCRPVHITNLYGGGNKAPYPGATSTLAADSENRKITVNVKSCTSIGNIFGGGLGDNAIVTGNTEVNINQIKGKFSKTSDGYAQNTYGDEEVEGLGTIGNVYGGGSQGKVVGNTSVNIGTVPTVTYVTGTNTTTAQDVLGVNITGSVYGGGLSADVEGNSVVKIGTATLAEGAIGVNIAKDVFGGGEGKTTNVSGNVTVEVGKDNGDHTFSGNATIGTDTYAGSVYGGSALGSVNTAASGNNAASGTVIVNLHKGTVKGAVYGGGMGEASVGENPGTEAKVFGDASVTLYGDVVTGGLYGGCNLNGTMYGNTVLNLYGGTVGAVLSAGASAPDMVFGGGLGKDTKVNGNVTVNIGDADNVGSTIYSNVYGGSAKGIVNSSATNTTTVNLFKGIVYGDVFGGGLGDADNAAEVKGKVVVNLNDNNGTCVVAGSIFGCNNTNGSPEDDVEVHIYNTVRLDGNNVVTTSPTLGEYELKAVYGGGKSAEYSASGKTTKVIIETCDPSIEEVYGGGYGADVPATNVEVKGAYEIGTVFGGGYGAGSDDPAAADYNPGANVNGITTVLLEGGTIHEAYGGSNTKGDVTGGTNVNVSDNGNTSCPLKVEQIYGGGKNAQMTGGTNIILGCQPDDWIKEIYAGAQAADVGGSVGLTITSGKFERVFGGNKTSGKINGSITVNIEETGTCATPIIIGELYGGGYQAGYSIYGYNNDNTPRTKAQYDTWYAGLSDEEKAKPENKPYSNPQLNVRSFTSIGAIYGGGYEALMVADPTVSINVVKGSHADDNDLAAGSTQPNSLPYPAHKKGAIGTIGNVFGGGNLATVDGSATVNIGTEEKAYFITEPIHLRTNSSTPMTPVESGDYAGLYEVTVEGANITGNVYGGGKLANITGSTEVNICAKYNSTTAKWESISYATGLAGVTIAGNVYGGGKGEARESGDRAFYCEEAMVGINDTNSETNNDAPDYANYGTHVRIGNGTVGTLDNSGKLVDGTGNVYGGGEIGRVEFHTEVVIGLGAGTEGAAKSPVINGSVFGAGKGTNTHGYSGLVRGDSRVTIQGDAKVGHSVYGGGEMASVGKYEVVDGLPKNPLWGGKCTVTIQGYAEIGPDNMQMTKEGGPDDTGHVFGAGKGTLPYENVTGTPWSMQTGGKVTYGEGKESDYYKFIQSLGLASNSDVTIDGHAFVKGSVYGGSENGYLQANTHVTIAGGQIGEGLGQTAPYADADFIDPSTTPVTTDKALATCATWTYDKVTTGKPYDKYAAHLNSTDNEYYYDAEFTKSSKGGAPVATDGHTYYGNVFGGGRGVVPFAAGKWHRAAGSVAGNTQVDITAGHILSSVYGGNENTDVGSYALGSDGEPTTTLSSGGTCTINITGGTVGVPRTKEQIEDNPVIGNVFGAGKGDKRVLFNTWTNVGATSVNISGTAKIYGSVFGGGEDGHVIGNAVSIIGGTVTTGVVGNTTEHAYSKVVIGSTGISGADGNVFGGGRGSETALTAGVVGGNVNLTIDNGNILGSVYGGGRLASVGTNFTNPTLENGEPDPRYGELQTPDADHGNIIVTVNDGTIGSSTSTGVNGNIFGGSKGTETNWKLGIARSTTINMTGGTAYASVYGGGELAQVVGSHTTSGQALGTEINISGGTIGIEKENLPEGTTYGATYGNVYGGGKGNTTHVEAGLIKTNTKVSISQADSKTTLIRHNIYGGGAYGSVGTITTGSVTYVPGIASVTAMPTAWAENTGTAEVYVYGGTIGTDGDENGMVFASSRGDVGTPEDGVDPNNRLAWVHDTKLVIGGEGKSPIIKGSVYGSGENGHVFENTIVEIHNGTIGVTTDDAFGGPNYRLRGNVYGGGCGEDTYPETDDFNPLAGIVLGATNVSIDGGQVAHNVYGAGALGSVVGKTTVTIADNAIIGVENGEGGSVFGAARGKEGITVPGSNLANSLVTEVNISGGQVWNSVYGGGEAGYVKQNVVVNMNGGVVAKDVYGGGALADTNTDNWDATKNDGAGGWAEGKTSASYTTTVNLLGGTIGGDAYGGGLGRLDKDAVAAQPAQGNEGDPDYVPAVEAQAAVSAVEAKVYGDVAITLGDVDKTNATAFNIKNYTGDHASVVKSGRVFGCNNLNGSPKGNVTVTVYKTVKGNTKRTAEDSNNPGFAITDNSVPHTYELAAVYGGGNLADYTPAENSKKTIVRIMTCDVSVEEVYGGGNAAAVPETDVLVNGAYEIAQVFGGGNGEDDYFLDGVWHKNPGANVVGNATTLLTGGFIHEAYGGSNSKGTISGNINISKGTGGDCTLNVMELYGAGKDADVEGDLIMVMGCSETRTERVYGCAKNANVKGNVELTITSGEYGKVFGGNNESGAIFGHIVINIEETGCTPIIIDELYGCGNDAAYSTYGYWQDGTIDGTVDGKPKFVPRTSADDEHTAVTFEGKEHTIPPYDDPEVNIISCTRIGKVFGGGFGTGATVYGNPKVNINQIFGLKSDGNGGYTTATELGRIGVDAKGSSDDCGVFGGGNLAKVVGNTTINIGTETTVQLHESYDTTIGYTMSDAKPILGANILSNVYGGGNEADVTGNTFVNICAVKSGDTYSAVAEGTKKVNIAGNVFGGGKGIADNFYCDKAMVGTDKAGETAGYLDGNTSVIIGNGTVGTLENGKLKEGTGSVYGGGEVGRVEMNTTVTIGLPDGGTSAPDIKGDVFGGGKGEKEHGYAALVRGNPTVTIQANAKVEHNVYGGGEIASVARYKVPLNDTELAAAHSAGYTDAVIGRPYALKDANSGFCTVTVKGKAVIGPDTPLKMYHADSNGNIPATDTPDDAGHVFGAGKGIMPENYAYDADQVGHKPRCRANDNSWTWFGDVNEYIAFIQTLALSSQTTVTIGDDDDNNCKPFIKGSVYGGSENGLVQFNTNVNIESGQIGWGKDAQDHAKEAYDDDVWADNYTPSEAIDLECPHWDYGIEEGEGTNKKKIYAPYDPNANATGDLDKYPPITGQTVGKSTEGGRKVASDGHTYYGNVFGGGSGSVPYFDTTEGISKYLNSAGTVKGNTNVTISGGHILTNVYGGCEATNVLGKATIKMTNGTIGVPRTKNQIIAHPVTCYLFGAGKGDQRIFFNKDTNVEDVEVEVSGGRIYGSVFGGGEDGHVMRDVKVTIGQDGGAGPKIGTVGSTYVDGNVFGGGRGFGGEALTAGNVGGAVDLTINGGTMLGSIYGGGRLASVGYGLYLTTETGYGEMRDDKEYDDPSKPISTTETAEQFFTNGRGHITVTVNGGTIGKEFDSDVEGEHSGNVFGGSMGRLTKLDGTSFDDSHWPLLATAKSTTVNINGGTIKRSVYGGGEMGTVTTDAIVNVSGGTIGTSGKGGAEFGNVYGGGKGYVDPAGSNYVTAGIIKGNTKVTVENGTNTPPTIYHNIYGGGAYGSVGTFTYDDNNVITGYTSGGKAEIYVTGGTIGTDGKENGMIFGSSRGDVGAPNSIHDKLAWVYDTHVAIGDTTSTTITTATPLIKGSVYGGGENGHNYRNAYVRINGGTIGIASGEPITDNNGTPDDTADDITYSGAEYPYRGNVYGGGCGTDKYYSTGTELHDGNGDTYNSKAGIVRGNAIVHVTEGHIVHNVYGAGAMGSVGTMTKDNDDHLDISSGGKTTIEISGGTVGVDGTDNGNVFGAARGDETTKQTDVALVKTTDVTVSGDATVWGNVYGGGEIGCVGTFTERADDGKYIWTSDDQNLNGLTKVSITGGETKGHVFGAGKGSAVTFKCEKAMVKKTQVSVSNGKVDKNVYGGGEIGRVEEDTDVKIGVGDGTCNPTILGSVYGAGAGLETHGYSALVRHNTTVTVDGGAKIGQSVYGGGEIASVGRYGLDEHKMPEILLDGGYCYVKVQGSATIGSTTVQGNVFGACKGVVPHFDKTNADRSKRSRRMTVYNASDFPDGAKIDATTGNASSMTSTNTTWEYYDESVTPKLVWEYFQEEDGYNKYLETLALATHPEVTIDGGATVNGSVYGGGEMGLTKGSVMVNILGGTITEDVYGGGALANTNTTSAVGVLNNVGIPQKESDGKYQTTTVYPKTTVNLLGGSMRDAYGGGLGQLALAAQGTEGQAGYQAAVPAIEAKVNGNVKVNLNGLQAATDINTSILNSLTTGSKLDAVGSGYIVKSSAKGAVVNRVFGCNNLNGTPTKKVQVYVFGTQKSDKAQLNLKAEKNTNTYDVQAVYGGGNLSPYDPADAYSTVNAIKDKARSEVYIYGCDLTSIKQVYGGGNAASVPATFVQVNSAFEIDEAFGGGNGYDPYNLNDEEYVNPGANVGYYNYTHFVKNTSTGKYEPVDNTDPDCSTKEARVANYSYGSGVARLEVYGGTIHTSYGGSNAKGNIRVKASSLYSANGDCEMKVGKSYGGGKNAPIDGIVDMIADCAHGVEEMFGGSENADVDNDINLVITNGSTLKRVFGGNNTSGAINGSITVTIKEGGCEPIRIGELYLGGYLAPYSIYGYKKKSDGSYETITETDEHGNTIYSRIPLESAQDGVTPHKNPHIDVISATSIGDIYGGGYKAKLVGNPHINVNMEPGQVVLTQTLKEGTEDQYILTDAMGDEYDPANYVISESGEGEGKKYIATLPIGEIGNIYGGGNMADIVGDTYVEIGTGTQHNDAGEIVAISPARNAAKITGNVFGGGKGVADDFECEKAMVGVAGSGAGSTNVTIGNGTVGGNVYGGGKLGRVEANTNVTIGLEPKEGETVTDAPVISGNVFGAGAGVATHGYSALVRGKSSVTVQGKAKVGKSVYGGGETASVGRFKVVNSLPTEPLSGGTCTVKIQGNAEIGSEGEGYVFGACKGVDPDYEHNEGHVINTGESKAFANEAEYLAFLKTLALTSNTNVTIGGNASVNGSVFGGGQRGIALGNVDVNMTGGTVTKDVYGGGALADTNTGNATSYDTSDETISSTSTYTTTVNLLGGTIGGEAFGGGLGEKTGVNDATSDVEAIVYGDVLVELNKGVAEDAKGCIVDKIFGANNINGTPKGHVTVHVYATQNKDLADIGTKSTVDGVYDVSYVFGGGNAADYVPAAADTKQSTEVIIEGCDLTSIQEVYGGGYGAATPATSILVKGTKIIDNVYGGGYGAGMDNPGANVGYKTNGHSEYGSGKAVVQLMAGTINNVYGGSNTKGDIRDGSSVTNVTNDGGPGCCDKLSVEEIYGGGKSADMYGGAEICLSCMPNDWIGSIYAGAEKADVGNDISLTLTSGKFERVYGGNKSGGKIDGYIEVNIEENPECSTPIIIGELYGGGNEASYEYSNLAKDPDYPSPRVNVRAFTSIGTIYGGGYGKTATVTGNPTVNINVVEGGREYAGDIRELEDGSKVSLYARSKDGKIGVIGNVFGGGNAAKVIGNTTVNVGTTTEEQMVSLQTTDEQGNVIVVKKPVVGADIRGNVYGGGNQAEVTGSTNVVVGKKTEE